MDRRDEEDRQVEKQLEISHTDVAGKDISDSRDKEREEKRCPNQQMIDSYLRILFPPECDSSMYERGYQQESIWNTPRAEVDESSNADYE